MIEDKNSLDFKLECLQTKEYVYFDGIEISRIIHMSDKWNKQIYRKLKPFYEFQKNGTKPEPKV